MRFEADGFRNISDLKSFKALARERTEIIVQHEKTSIFHSKYPKTA
jgi:hypothetical protein